MSFSSAHFETAPPPAPLLAETCAVEPIRRTVDGLGDVALQGVRQTRNGAADQTERQHRLYGVTINGYQHATEITDPVNGDPHYAILSLPGYSEHIEHDIRKDFHAGLAEKFPQARVVSVGSDGIGPHSGSYRWSERHGYDLDGMARHRVELVLALAAELPLFVQATSMGTIISHRMNKLILDDPDLKHAVDLRGQFYTSPALVDPSNIVRDMGVRFLPGISWDFTKEMLFKTAPKEAYEIIKNSTHSGLSTADKTALANQFWDLWHGTRESEIGPVIAEIPTVVVAGQKDSLAQWRMWNRLKRAYPEQLELHPIRGRGHMMTMKPGRTCDKLARTAQAKVCQSLGEKSVLASVS